VYAKLALGCRIRSDWREETGEVMARKQAKWEEGGAENNIMTQEEKETRGWRK